MKIIKKIVVFLLILLAIPLLIALFIEKDYAVEREVDIARSNQEVFAYIKMLKNQGEYSVWQQMDPKMKRTYSGTDGTVGFISAWNSKNKDVGVGEQEIKKITEGKRIDFELRFMEPFEAKDLAYMETESKGEKSTTVRWGFNGSMNYPMNFMLLFMDMEEILGKDLQGGLDNLKNVLEKK